MNIKVKDSKGYYYAGRTDQTFSRNDIGTVFDAEIVSRDDLMGVRPRTCSLFIANVDLIRKDVLVLVK